MEIGLGRVVRDRIAVQGDVEGEGSAVIDQLQTGIRDPVMDLHPEIEALDPGLQGVEISRDVLPLVLGRKRVKFLRSENDM